MAKITKQEVISKLALHNRLGSNTAASEVLDELLAIITTEVAAGNEVYLGTAFGGFKPSIQPARSGEAMGVKYETPAKQVIKFKPSAALKETVAA